MPTISSKALTAGEVVFEGKPLVHVLYDKYKAKHCDNCLKRSDSLKRCAKCLQMFYCDRNCQTFDWIHHKNECKLMAVKKSFNFDEMQRICIRFMFCIKNDKTFATKRHQSVDGSDVCLNDIAVNVKELVKNRELMESFNECKALFKYLGLKFKHLFHWLGVLNTKLLIISLMTINDSSAVNTSEPTNHLNRPFNYYCFGLYIQTSTLSHSCLPNTAIVNNGLTLQVRAMKAIGSGEELTISYIDLYRNKTDRQSDLKQYLIDCKCLKCEQTLDSGVDYQSVRQFIPRLTASSIIPALRTKFLSIPEFVSDLNTIFGQYFPQKTLILGQLSVMCLNPIRLTFPDLIPALILSELAKQLDDSIRVTHGESHPFNRLIVETLSKY